MNESKTIVEVAMGYLGQQEISGNKGFKDEAFEEKMRTVGWQPPWAWCSFFAMLVYREAYGALNSVIEADLRKLISPSATATYNNFKSSKDYKRYVSNKPTVGSLAVWRQGTGWQGHIGIVVGLNGNKEFKSIEGNTNSSGGREGIEVAIMRRLLDFTSKPTGLNLIGFINPPSVENH
jgi:hypothetical protein